MSETQSRAPRMRAEGGVWEGAERISQEIVRKSGESAEICAERV